MFGPAYQSKMVLEVFLRYLEPGIHNILDIRKALYFIPDKAFANVLKEASERGLITINTESRKIFVRRKTVDVIRFVEKYDFINELQKHEFDNNHSFEEELQALLKKVRYSEHKYVDVSNELANCMRVEKDDDYSAEILNFRFYLKK